MVDDGMTPEEFDKRATDGEPVELRVRLREANSRTASAATTITYDPASPPLGFKAKSIGDMVGILKPEPPPAAIWVDPGRMGGQPCIYGHRLTTQQVARMVRDHGIEVIHSGWPYLTDEQIGAAVWFEGVHGRSKKFRKWYREEWRP